ncbi:hypothetical protein SCHPADRAFT_925258 [Schizopora paradoxa]|uniref:Uncharacterized protein n=1 Tax=Schizopora paradoxa TaxID=27342 RepID=A0A0H2S2K9_9AGAM|nr:hypothetical protein SCHPADRAFT_925258 [Schizopora paradoxa]
MSLDRMRPERGDAVAMESRSSLEFDSARWSEYLGTKWRAVVRHPSSFEPGGMPLKLWKKRLKRSIRRRRDSPFTKGESDSKSASAEPPPPPTQQQRERTTTKSKCAKRAALAVASHGFDFLQQVSDSFGPLKSVVSGVGYMKNVWQNSKDNVQQARALRSDVQAFHDQVTDGLGCDSSAIPSPVVHSLIELDKALDQIDATTKPFIEDHFGSRLLHHKEHVKGLKDAQAKFRATKERFSMDCNLMTVLMFTNHIPSQREKLQIDSKETEENKVVLTMHPESLGRTEAHLFIDGETLFKSASTSVPPYTACEGGGCTMVRILLEIATGLLAPMAI